MVCIAVGYFIAMPWLFDNVVLAPCHNDFVFYDVLRYVGKVFDLHDDFFTQDFHVKLININLAAPFFIHMSTAFWMSVVTLRLISFLKSGGLSVLRSMLMSGVA